MPAIDTVPFLPIYPAGRTSPRRIAPMRTSPSSTATRRWRSSSAAPVCLRARSAAMRCSSRFADEIEQQTLEAWRRE